MKEIQIAIYLVPEEGDHTPIQVGEMNILYLVGKKAADIKTMLFNTATTGIRGFEEGSTGASATRLEAILKTNNILRPGPDNKDLGDDDIIPIATEKLCYYCDLKKGFRYHEQRISKNEVILQKSDLTKHHSTIEKTAACASMSSLYLEIALGILPQRLMQTETRLMTTLAILPITLTIGLEFRYNKQLDSKKTACTMLFGLAIFGLASTYIPQYIISEGAKNVVFKGCSLIQVVSCAALLYSATQQNSPSPW
jgi:hypothetical protein